MADADAEHGDQPDGPAAAALPAIPDYGTLPVRPTPTPMGDVAVVAVKIVALYCFVQALSIIYVVPASLMLLIGQGPGEAAAALLGLLDPVLFLVVGILLVKRATWVATTVLGFEEPSGDRVLRSPGRRLQAIAFSVAGVWLGLQASAELIGLFVRAFFDARFTGNDLIRSAMAEPSGLASAVAKLALGVGLFFGAKRLAWFWHRFRMRVNPTPRDDVQASSSSSGDGARL